MTEGERTLFCGNLSEEVTEDLLFELFLQAGPVSEVRIPKLKGKPRPFGFVIFKHECSVEYAAELMKTTEMFGRRLTLRPSKPKKIDDFDSALKDWVERRGDNGSKRHASDMYDQDFDHRRASSSQSSFNSNESYQSRRQSDSRIKDRLGVPVDNNINTLRGLSGGHHKRGSDMLPSDNAKRRRYDHEQKFMAPNFNSHDKRMGANQMGGFVKYDLYPSQRSNDFAGSAHNREVRGRHFLGDSRDHRRDHRSHHRQRY